LNLRQTEGKTDDTKVPVRRNSRRKPSDDTDPVQPKKLLEKRSTRSGKLKIRDTDNMQHDASSEVAPVLKRYMLGKLSGRERW